MTTGDISIVVDFKTDSAVLNFRSVMLIRGFSAIVVGGIKSLIDGDKAVGRVSNAVVLGDSKEVVVNNETVEDPDTDADTLVVITVALRGPVPVMVAEGVVVENVVAKAL